MSVLLKPGEAMSHGRIMRIQKEESKIIKAHMKAFFKDGGNVEQVKTGESGIKDGAKHKFSI
jgi:hypothetical protein